MARCHENTRSINQWIQLPRLSSRGHLDRNTGHCKQYMSSLTKEELVQHQVEMTAGKLKEVI